MTSLWPKHSNSFRKKLTEKKKKSNNMGKSYIGGTAEN